MGVRLTLIIVALWVLGCGEADEPLPSDFGLEPDSRPDLASPPDMKAPPLDKKVTPPLDKKVTPPPDKKITPPPDKKITPDKAPPPDKGAPPPLKIHLSPTGKDSRDGKTLKTAILTLARAQQIIAGLKPKGEVQVHIAPGTYQGQKVIWTYTDPALKIRFMPLGGGKVRPIFDGCLTKTSCPGGTWFILKHSKGERTNLHFEYVQVQNYHTAISLNGDRNSTKTSNSHNRIYGCYFYNIGNVYNPALNYSTAAVRLVNSDDNVIGNTHFINIINTKSAGLIHAIYAAHLSDRNQILGNRFKNNSGDPVRLRDFSNFNVIKNNKFIKVGVYAGYTDWYCNHDIYTNCTKKGPECASWENQFRDNLLDGTYACAKLGTFKYFQGDTAKGCAPPKSGAKRLYTSGNKSTAKPCTN